jgi:hypothetical protein
MRQYGASVRVLADAAAPKTGEVRSRSARRREQRDRAAARIAELGYAPAGPRSRYTRPEIAEVVREHVDDAPREPKRTVVEPHWERRSEPAEPPPVTLITLRGPR